jgi:ADP-heptose:LPS heptosyltransferase
MLGFVKAFVDVVTECRSTGYDVVIDFEQFIRLSAIICLLSKGTQRVGFRTANQHRRLAYTKALPYDPSTHTFDNFLLLLGLLGISEEPGRLEEICTSQKDKAVVTKLIQDSGISNGNLVIGIHPGSGGTAKSRRWEPSNFSKMADLLIEHYGARIVFTGTRDEHGLIDSILSGAKNKRDCLNFAGRVTLGQLPFLVNRFQGYLSNDTGPLHIAVAMKVPVVALFGPNTPLRYGPIGDGHRVIYKALECSPCIIAHEGIVPYCKNNRCMQDIGVDEVWKALELILHE